MLTVMHLDLVQNSAMGEETKPAAEDLFVGSCKVARYCNE